jgi:putative transposase
MPDIGSRPRSYIRRFGSISGSHSAFVTSSILLAEHGIAVSYETVRSRVHHLGPIIAAHLRKRRAKPHTAWHLDEVYLKIEGEVLEVLVQSKRDKHATLKLMRKLLKNYAFVPDRW